MALWKVSNKSDLIRPKDECFHELIQECTHLPPGSKFSNNLRSRLEKFSVECRKEIVSRTKGGCAPLFIASKMGQTDMVVYLIKCCQADIEQKGIYEVPEYDKITHLVTPLWCAAVSGKLPVVKLLLEFGANINATSDTGSTPVRSACFMTHLDIVKYLVDNGADINKPNFNGGTCLINSVQSLYLCNYLIKNGAIVNTKDIQNKTALHYAVQEHRLETTELLLDYGANHLAMSKCGDDALKTACLKGAYAIFEYLTERLSYSQETLATAHELLGTTFLDENSDLQMALEHWKKAQAIRESAGLLPKQPLVEPKAAYRYLKEYSTMEELENWADLNWVRMQSLLIAERILGPFHKDFLFKIMFRGASYVNVMQHQRCIDLWLHALEIRVMKDTILYSDTCYTAQALVRVMVDYNKKTILSAEEDGSAEQRFNDSVKAFTLLSSKLAEHKQSLSIRPQFQRHMENFDRILKCITHLIYLMLQTYTNDTQLDYVRKLVTDLIKMNPTSGLGEDTLLHLSVSKLNTIKSTYFMDEDPVVIFPKKQVIEFLLSCGASVNARNESKSTPLHLATMSYNRSVWLVQMLLDYGGHVDQPNAYGETPAQILSDSPLHLDIRLINYVSLKCLCANAIAKHRITYERRVPKTLETFIQMHQC